MLLNPTQARRLAGILLEDDSEVPEPGAALGGRSFGNYRVSRLVGVGGMGEVYEAQQDRTGRRVAIKVIRSELISADLHRRFEHEVRLLARLQHPGIAQVYEAGRVETAGGNTPYFAMEFVEGRTLTKYAADNNLSIRQRLDLFLKVCDAVEHAHRKGVIHRDLKPANILVDATGQPRILDFGVARATDADLQATTLHTDIGKVIGTLPYMSPEQISGDPDALDTRSDVYSLGVVLYELLAGKPPYDVSRAQIHEAARIIKEDDPTRLGLINKDLAGDIELIVGKTLEKHRDGRYQSAADVAADVRRHISNEPIAARPPSFTYQFRKLATRHRAVVAGSFMAIILITAGAITSTWFAMKERTARQEADRNALDLSRRAATSAGVVSFLQKTLGSADPARKGRDARVVDMLDGAEEDVESVSKEDPTVAAAVLTAIGSSYLGLGDAHTAEADFRRAVGYWERAGLSTSSDAIQTRAYLAMALTSLGREAEARPILDAVQAETEAALGPTHPDSIAALNNLALAMMHMGELEKAEEYSRRTVEWHRSIGDRDSKEYFTDLDTLSHVLQTKGNFDEAGKLLEEALNGQRLKYGDDDIETIQEAHNYASLLIKTKAYAKAEVLLRDVLERRTRLLGESHPSTFTTMNLLGVALRSQRKLDEAEKILMAAYKGREAKLGPEHPRTLLSMQTIALLLEEKGDIDGAIDMTRQVLEKRRRILGDKNGETMESARIVGDMLRRAHRYDEALAAYDAAEPLIVAFAGADGFEYARLFGLKGDCQLKAGRFLEAEQQLRHCEDLALKIPEGKRVLPMVRKSLVEVYTALGQPDDAARYKALLPNANSNAEKPVGDSPPSSK